jgi:hypothetical protein
MQPKDRIVEVISKLTSSNFFCLCRVLSKFLSLPIPSVCFGSQVVCVEARQSPSLQVPSLRRYYHDGCPPPLLAVPRPVRPAALSISIFCNRPNSGESNESRCAGGTDQLALPSAARCAVPTGNMTFIVVASSAHSDRLVAAPGPADRPWS